MVFKEQTHLYPVHGGVLQICITAFNYMEVLRVIMQTELISKKLTLIR